MPRSALIAGSATFTTVLSSMIMKRAKQSAPNVHQRRFSSAKILARTAPPTGRKLARTRLARTSQSVKVTLARVEVIWRPDDATRERTNALRLARKLGFDDYASLVRFSQDEPERFWPAAIEDMELEFSRPWDAVVDQSRGPEWATWFVGGRLNLAWNCVHRWAHGERADAPAAVWQSEDGQRRSLTYSEVSAEVTRLAEALARLGVEPGDRVALFLPMSPEVAIASHACAHLGAIQVPIFSGFAAPAIASRLQHAEGKGFSFAESNQEKWHGLAAYDPVTGEARKKSSGPPAWTQVVGTALTALAGEHPDLVAITAAMPSGTGTGIFQGKYPERFFDVGIAEGHAVTFAAGLAAQGILPVCAIYSTFLQRAYDNVIHDVAVQHLPVIFCMDRAGLVGEDGQTHMGLYDIAYML